MAKVHVSGDGHTAPLPSGKYEFRPFDEGRKKVVDRALSILKNNVKGMKPCNDCFQKLPNGRTFDAILDDPDVFIHYFPDNTGTMYGGTVAGSKNVTISDYVIRMGRWMVAATLVHEFAHVNGAGGGHDAEATLPCCGFGAADHYDPNIMG
jgi:hypothetical protein